MGVIRRSRRVERRLKRIESLTASLTQTSEVCLPLVWLTNGKI